MRVRANGSGKSFRQLDKLQEHLDKERPQVETLKQLLEEDPGVASTREQAARARVARERLEPVEQAIENVKALREQKQADKRKKHTPEQIEKTVRDSPWTAYSAGWAKHSG